MKFKENVEVSHTPVSTYPCTTHPPYRAPSLSPCTQNTASPNVQFSKEKVGLPFSIVILWQLQKVELWTLDENKIWRSKESPFHRSPAATHSGKRLMGPWFSMKQQLQSKKGEIWGKQLSGITLSNQAKCWERHFVSTFAVSAEWCIVCFLNVY